MITFNDFLSRSALFLLYSQQYSYPPSSYALHMFLTKIKHYFNDFVSREKNCMKPKLLLLK